MSRGILQERLRQSLEASKRAHTHKLLRYIDSPMGPVARIDGLGEVVVLCSNNYLGLADHPKVVEAAQQGFALGRSTHAQLRAQDVQNVS